MGRIPNCLSAPTTGFIILVNTLGADRCQAKGKTYKLVCFLLLLESGGDIGSLGELGPVGRHPSGRVSPSSPKAGLDLEGGEDLPS